MYRGSRSWLLTLIGLVVLSIDAHQEKHCGPSTDQIKYDWEKFDYYTILDLASAGSKASRRKRQATRQKFQAKDIKRAYRRQAQLHHPDKKNDTVSLQESNSRFSRIAEAYEVLQDESKRGRYDRWLLDCEDTVQAASSSSNQRSHQRSDRWFDNLRTKDPRQVFEEFFYRSSGSTGGFFRDGYPSQDHPVRVQEHREVMRDLNGNEFVRVFRTEEYLGGVDGSLYYRIIGQDYAEQFERFHGWTFKPISRQFLVEEGYRQETNDKRGGRDKNAKSTLHAGETLTQSSSVLLSRNSRYYAGITDDCALIIMSVSLVKGMDDDVLIWSSNTFVPPVYGTNSCFLSLRGPHLVLSAGDRDRPGAILWHSDVSESIMLNEARLKESGYPAPTYFARLDDDGSLVVYTLQSVSPQDQNNVGEDRTEPTWLSKVMGKSKSLAKTKVKHAFHIIRKWKQILLRKPEPRSEDNESSHESEHEEEICIFATGLAGCHSGGRKLFKFARGLGQSVKATMSKIDSAIDSVCESFQGDEDDDFLDTLTRILGQTGARLGNVCQKIAASSLKALQDVVENR